MTLLIIALAALCIWCMATQYRVLQQNALQPIVLEPCRAEHRSTAAAMSHQHNSHHRQHASNAELW
ncbi:MAG: hypothetical protein ACI9WS_000464 [Paraglaciecola psychrophila]|jgi:hypothetical protein